MIKAYGGSGEGEGGGSSQVTLVNYAPDFPDRTDSRSAACYAKGRTMTMRTIYLQQYLSVNGRNALSGRVLFDKFKELSEEILLGHMICDDEVFSKITEPALKQDIVCHALVREFRPDVIYMEGGLFADDKGTWRIPKQIADEVCANAGVIIVADVEHNRLYGQKDHYLEAGQFFKAFAAYGKDDEDLVYASDETSFWKGYRQILCKPEKMILSDWIRPIYDGIPSVLAGSPIRLASWDCILASCNGDTTGTLHLDNCVDMVDACPFASVTQRGAGYLAFIAANVSADAWLEGCPHNTKWLTRVAEFLVHQARSDRARRVSHRRSRHLLFLSHRSTDKGVVRQMALAIKNEGVAVWFDEERLIPSQSLVEEINHALEKMTHYVLFWSRSCIDAPWVTKELHSAVSRLVEKEVPLFVVRLDETPVPAIIADIFRIEALGYTPEEIGTRIADAVERLASKK